MYEKVYVICGTVFEKQFLVNWDELSDRPSICLQACISVTMTFCTVAREVIPCKTIQIYSTSVVRDCQYHTQYIIQFKIHRTFGPISTDNFSTARYPRKTMENDILYRRKRMRRQSQTTDDFSSAAQTDKVCSGYPRLRFRNITRVKRTCNFHKINFFNNIVSITSREGRPRQEGYYGFTTIFQIIPVSLA